MESKYKERADELLKETITDSNGDICKNYSKSDIIEAMCELAEEVEQQYKNPMTFDANTHQVTINPLFRSDSVYYSRKEVEELLQKQKELFLNETLEYLSNVDYSNKSNYTVTEAIYDAFQDAKLKID